MKKTAFILFAFMCCFLPLKAEEPEIIDKTQNIFANAITSYGTPSKRKFMFQLYYKKVELGGKMVIKGEPHASEVVNMSNLSKLDEEYALGSRFKYNFGSRTSAEISYIQFEHSGNLKVPRAFNGYQLKTGSKFNIKNRIFDIMFNRKFMREEDALAKYELFALGGIRIINSVITARGSQTGTTDQYVYANWEKTFPVPYLGMKGGWKLGRATKLNGHLIYSVFPTTDGYDAEFYDIGTNVTFDFSESKFGNLLQLELGYNQEMYDIDGHGNGIQFKFSGPFASLNLVF